MDDLESRLGDGLRSHADRLPRYEGNLTTVTRRGRNRLWAVRSAGALGALVLLGGGVAFYNATRDNGEAIVADGDPVPLVEPTPEATPDPTPVPTPDPTPAPTVIDPVQLTFLAATDWGVGLVGPTGDLYAPLVCCEEGAALAARPVIARDDLRGGIIAATTDTIVWVDADALASGDEPRLVAAPAPADSDATAGVALWDIADFDGTPTLLYSMNTATDDGSGSSTLYALELGADDATPTVLASSSWTDEDREGAFTFADASWLPGGGYASLEASMGEPCEWLTFAGVTESGATAPAATDVVNRFPRPTDLADCPYDSLGALAVNADGTVAVSHRYLSPRPELLVFDRAGNELLSIDLAAGTENQGRWTELDFLDDQIIIGRRADTAAPDWLTLDQTIRVDINGERGIGVFYAGGLTFPRVDIATDSLEPLEPSSRRWFANPGGRPAEADPTPAATAVTTVTPGPTPTTDPAATPEPEPTPSAKPTIPDEARIPTGRGSDIKTSGRLEGDRGCYGPVCVGDPIAEALDAAEAAFGPEDSASPDAALEGEPPAPESHVFLTAAERVTITEAEGQVTEIRTSPLDRSGLIEAKRSYTLGDVLAIHGAPAEVFNGGGEGSQVLWLLYDTDTAFVAYGFVEFRGDAEPTLLPEGDTTLDPGYDALFVNAYWARAQS